MPRTRESQGAYRIVGLKDLEGLREGRVVARRDFHSVRVDLAHLGRPERWRWERQLNTPLRSNGEICGLIGSLTGAVLYVLLAATAASGPGADWGLLGVGFVLIVLGGALGKMLGGWTAVLVFLHRAGRLERLVGERVPELPSRRRRPRSRTLEPSASPP